MVTHDSRLASWADRVVVLRDGRIVDAKTVILLQWAALTGLV